MIKLKALVLFQAMMEKTILFMFMG
ncbi:uncharacterized protein METZ01_LOCUS104940 [marine metagenome]|uniref:Uncharacterized protein n=1 Tax=marine metagenome TaxID=408172 RepID=A0A381WHU4_9ZZZZ